MTKTTLFKIMNESYNTGKRPNFRNANFCGHRLIDFDFKHADLSGANFRDVDLTGADFHDAILTNANFTGAYLTDANFVGTSLTGANFDYADLSGMKISVGNRIVKLNP